MKNFYEVSGEEMQQPPREKSLRPSGARRTQRTQPALPGASLPTLPLMAARPGREWTLPSPKKSTDRARRSLLLLVLWGLLLGLLYLACYPLLAGALRGASAAGLVTQMFPWLPRLYWTTWAPFLVNVFSRVSLFDIRPTIPSEVAVAGSTHLLLCFFALAFLCLVLVVRMSRRVSRSRLLPGEARFLWCAVMFFTLVFGILFVLAPATLFQDVFLSAWYGRMVTVYHVNPFGDNSMFYAGDLLRVVLAKPPVVPPVSGPLWIDMTIPVTLLARESLPHLLLGFRLVGLIFHLANALLLWAVLARVKPQARVVGTLLYAWNPAVLLLGIGEMHAEIVALTLLLLGAFFFQRRSFLLSWVCVLLAALFNPLCLVLLPLALRLVGKEMRTSRGRVLWWLSLCAISALVVALAYAPYWHGWALPGLLAQLQQVFWNTSILHSLNAAVAKLPFSSFPTLAWLASPVSWLLFGALLATGLLLLGIWLIDSLELCLLFGGWIFLTLFILSPTNWPWYILLPLGLTLASASRRTTLLTVLLSSGALLAYYFDLPSTNWSSQALVTVGLPLIIWGWTLFFSSTWEMTHMEREDEKALVKPLRGAGFSRVSWPSRPASWPSRSSWPGRRR